MIEEITEEVKSTVQYKSVFNAIEFNTENPLVEAASWLILLFIALKNTQTEIDVNHLRRDTMAEMNIFVNKAKSSQCSSPLILAARYCLCTALDEAILLTPWGSKSDWAQQSLLSHIHRETWGGERFFIILEKMASEPKKNLLILELLYLLLTLGFEGKYYNEDRMLREKLQHRLYQLIINNHPEENQNLSPGLDIVKKAHLKKLTKSYFLRFVLGILGGVFCIGLIFNTLLYWKAKPFLQDLKDISITHSVFIFPDSLPETQPKNKINYYSHIMRHHHCDDNKYKENHDNIILPPPVWKN